MSATMTGRRTESKRQIDVTNVPAEEMRAYVRTARLEEREFHLERRAGRTFLIAR